MICTHCGNCMPDNASVCDFCHLPLTKKPEWSRDAMSFRQGQARVDQQLANEPPAVLPQGHFRKRAPEQPASRRRQGSGQGAPKQMVNWTKVLVYCSVLILLSAAGVYLYLKNTDHGQYLMARMGLEGNASAYWRLGQEYAMTGELGKAVESYMKADELEKNNYEKLQWLADAYEAMGNTRDAEEVYLRMIQIDPKVESAYRSLIRLYQAQNRIPEAAMIMKDAYDKTGEASFRAQRAQTVPEQPEASVKAGRYTHEQTIELASSQEYDIYYTLGEGDLPESGEKYSQAITLGEGVHTLTAVCVNGDLISDPLVTAYTISYPLPDAPKSNLAPGTYEKQRSLHLRVQGEDPNVTLYYTIDGRPPTINSPIYTGEAIKLPIGSTTLRAVAVNAFGKVSNELNETYKIKGTVIRFYRAADDVFTGAEPLITTIDAFKEQFGAPTDEQPIQDDNMDGECVQLTYDWGEARFVKMASKHVLYYLITTRSSMKAPRSTNVGDTLSFVLGKYRDVGQVANAKGNRSLYYDEDTGYGQMTRLGDDSCRIDYVNITADSTITLSYYAANDHIWRIMLSAKMN